MGWGWKSHPYSLRRAIPLLISSSDIGNIENNWFAGFLTFTFSLIGVNTYQLCFPSWICLKIVDPKMVGFPLNPFEPTPTEHLLVSSRAPFKPRCQGILHEHEARGNAGLCNSRGRLRQTAQQLSKQLNSPTAQQPNSPTAQQPNNLNPAVNNQSASQPKNKQLDKHSWGCPQIPCQNPKIT